MRLQKGFGLLPILILVLVAILVAGAGYFVYNKNKADDSNNIPEYSAQPDMVNSETNSNNEDFKDTRINQFNSDLLGVNFIYPAGWTVKENREENNNKVDIVSPDYKDRETPVGFDEVTSGAKVTLYNADNNGQTPADRFDNSEFYKYASVDGYQLVTLGDNKGIKYIINYEAPPYTVYDMSLGSKILSVIYYSKDNNQQTETFKNYNEIISSIKAN